MSDLAPIILFVYNRPKHTLQTLEALNKNELAEQSVLYIFADGAKHDSSQENLKNIKEVRRIIRQKQWCKQTIINEQAINKGLAKSIIEGVTEVVNKHGKVIVLEDDLITGKFFLKFLNDALNIYKHSNNVFGVTGYCYFDDIKIEKPYLLPIGSSWGWATWKDKWTCFESNPFSLINEIDNKGLKNKFDFGGYPFYPMLYDNCLSKNDSWAIRFYASFFLKSGFFLFPNKSIVHNIGFDASGTHCGDQSIYNPMLYNGEIKVSNLTTSSNLKILKKVEKRFSKEFSNRHKINVIHKILARIKSKFKEYAIIKI